MSFYYNTKNLLIFKHLQFFLRFFPISIHEFVQVHLRFDFRPGDGSVVVVVHPNVVLVPLPLFSVCHDVTNSNGARMYMAEKLDYLMVYVVGEAEEWEMVENDCPPLYNEDFLEVNAVKPPVHRSLPEHPFRVVVAENEVDVTVQSVRIRITLQTPVPLLNVAEAEVSKVIYMVIGPYDRVPVGHESFIHFLNRPERPVAVFDYVLMKEVS